jgi:two-component system phosphate regulon response regulator OmpR
MDDQPHILVVDDDNRLRDLLSQYLGENGFRVTTASDAEEARRRMHGLQFDLLVVDVMMPGESGLELTKSLRTVSPLPILLLTAMSEPLERVVGLEQGADDYLTKPFEPRELVLRIESILRRLTPNRAKGPVKLGECQFDMARRELRRANAIIRLTTIEANLLSALAKSAGIALSRNELITRCQIDGTERTVDVQVTRLRRKIENDPREPRYLQTIRGQGYVLHPD